MFSIKDNNLYKVNKSFNNNVIWVIESETEKELILIGKGLGFNYKEGDLINLAKESSNIEEEFSPVNENKKKEYRQLLETADKKVIGVTEEIINMISVQLEEDLADHIHIGLADHIGFVLKRLKKDIKIDNPFLYEIKSLYPKEYKLAQEAVEMIENRFEIFIPKAEIGFITLHINSARINRELSTTMKETQLIKNLVDIIETELEINFSEGSLTYARLLTHLRFALQRIEKNQTEDNPLLDNLKNQFKESYQLAEKLALYIEDNINDKVPEDEVGYIAMHLQRLNN